MANKNNKLRRFFVILSLVFAGEMIFSLPFHVARFFRPTLLSVFELSNTALGAIFAVFGLTATLVYFPGGVVADYFSARRLMVASLFATALGGLYMAQIPGAVGLSILYGYWGITSIFLFWAAMIKATRDWGGESHQGRAFGLLDGGRGLAAAAVASLAVLLMSNMMPAVVDSATTEQRRTALQSIIYLYSFATAGAGILVWFCIPDSTRAKAQSFGFALKGLKDVIARKSIWFQAAIVVCAYCGYKGLDNYSLYAVDVMGLNEVEAARLTSIAAYLRPLSAVAAGFIADRVTVSYLIGASFSLLLVSYLVLAFFLPDALGVTIIYGNIVLSFCCVYALRGVYFALIEESKVASNRTGAAAGLVSVVGFTPDMFFTPLAGYILDASPGAEGHLNFFRLMIVIAFIGILATVLLRKWCISKTVDDTSHIARESART